MFSLTLGLEEALLIIPAVNNRKGVELTVRIRWLIIPTMLSIFDLSHP